MKKVNDMLIQLWGKGFKRELTEEDIHAMVKLDMELSSSIPDASRDKMDFLQKMEEKYKNLGIQEIQQKWAEEIGRLKHMYPLIHKEKE